MLIPITENELSSLRQKADQSERKRINYNFHEQLDDPVQRMLNSMNRGTYFQPHRHKNPDKRETFIILTGRVAVIEFDDEGAILSHINLDHQLENYGTEIPIGTWHTLIVLENGSVVYEVKDGPYSPIDDKNFAPWAPKEGTAGCTEFIEDIIAKLELE
jgi:cupin fold WbuC family metalloprotein